MASASGPLSRMTPTPPPEAVATAAMVSSPGSMDADTTPSEAQLATAERFNEALEAIDGGDPQRALPLLRDVVDADPSDGEALLILAQLERDLGEADVARARLSARVASAPDDYEARVEFADLLLGAGEVAQAASVIREVLVTRPNHFDALFLLGSCFMDVEAYEEAARAFGAGVEVNPFSGVCWFNLARARERLGEADEAASAYRAYLKAVPRADDRTEVEAWIAALEGA